MDILPTDFSVKTLKTFDDFALYYILPFLNLTEIMVRK